MVHDRDDDHVIATDAVVNRVGKAPKRDAADVTASNWPTIGCSKHRFESVVKTVEKSGNHAIGGLAVPGSRAEDVGVCGLSDDKTIRHASSGAAFRAKFLADVFPRQ